MRAIINFLNINDFDLSLLPSVINIYKIKIAADITPRKNIKDEGHRLINISKFIYIFKNK